jgi:hypothetical protein
LRRAAKIDDNQVEIVAALRKIGCSVVSLAAVGSGCPDLLIGYRAMNFLVEVKDGNKSPSRRQLTEDQKVFHREWNGQIRVVESVEEAVKLVTESYVRPSPTG